MPYRWIIMPCNNNKRNSIIMPDKCCPHWAFPFFLPSFLNELSVSWDNFWQAAMHPCSLCCSKLIGKSQSNVQTYIVHTFKFNEYKLQLNYYVCNKTCIMNPIHFKQNWNRLQRCCLKSSFSYINIIRMRVVLTVAVVYEQV